MGLVYGDEPGVEGDEEVVVRTREHALDGGRVVAVRVSLARKAVQVEKGRQQRIAARASPCQGGFDARERASPEGLAPFRANSTNISILLSSVCFVVLGSLDRVPMCVVW
jgi:hypothetical protein